MTICTREKYVLISNSCLIAADEGTGNYKLFKTANLVSMVAAPLALANVGSDVMAFDYVLCASLPITFHIGANWVITDYVRVFANEPFCFLVFVCSDVSLTRYAIFLIAYRSRMSTRRLEMPPESLWFFCPWARLQA